MKPEHPTGLEIRFERELAKEIPGWKSEVASLDPLVEARPPRAACRRVLPRRVRDPRKRRSPGGQR